MNNPALIEIEDNVHDHLHTQFLMESERYHREIR